MEASNNSSIIAPFVMKTYQMVNDPSTNGFISWGPANNSFIVLEPLDFSQRILPAYFKHNNFSSFVRQLNTYGFRKVDPDRWEFANEWFLRGQIQLLYNIARRKHSGSNKTYTSNLIKQEDDEDEELIVEIAKLKEEQKGLEEEMESMNRRLEATERRPQQMMTFLYKVVDDPEILPRMMLEKEKSKMLIFNDKKRKTMISGDSSNSSSGMAMSSSSIKSLSNDQEINYVGDATPISSPDGNRQSSPSLEISSSHEWLTHTQGESVPVMMMTRGHQHYASVSNLPLMSSSDGGFGWDQQRMSSFAGYSDSGGTSYFGEGSSSPPPYPFSLLGGGF